MSFPLDREVRHVQTHRMQAHHMRGLNRTFLNGRWEFIVFLGRREPEEYRVKGIQLL